MARMKALVPKDRRKKGLQAEGYPGSRSLVGEKRRAKSARALEHLPRGALPSIPTRPSAEAAVPQHPLLHVVGEGGSVHAGSEVTDCPGVIICGFKAESPFLGPREE